MKFFPKAIFFLTILFFLSCSSEPTVDNKPVPSTPKVNSNEEMAQILNKLALNADPRENYHMNSRRAQMWGQQAQQLQDPTQKIMANFQMGAELLNAGKLEDAIKVFEGISAQFQGMGLGMNDQTKALYELMAVAYLRLGEQQNCLGTYAPSSCILPLKEEAYHKLKTGSQKAIEIYKQILEAYPNDMQSRWLLNLAYMTLGQYPGEVPSKWRIPESAFVSENSNFPYFPNKAPALKVDNRGLSGGVCLEDFNNDGKIDIFVTSYGYNDAPTLYFNTGNGFEDKTASAGIAELKGGLNTSHADYNNDGYIDIYILRGGWLGKGGNHPNSLLKNNGDGTFTDVTKASGLFRPKPTQTAAWADFDNDGWLDLFVGAEAVKVGGAALDNPSVLWRNNGDGTFTDVTTAMGINVKAFVKGVAWGDANNDGWPDLYVSTLDSPNFLYENVAGKGFKNVAATAGVAEPVQSFPAWFWDFNNDGWQDLFISGYDLKQLNFVGGEAGAEYSSKTTQGEPPRLYKNNGDGTFTDVATEMGLNHMLYSMGANFGDLDNDGFLDFYVGTGAPDFRSVVPNRMFRNVAGNRFEEVTMSGFGHIQKGHGVGFADLDNDGDQDIYAVMGGAFEGDVAQNVLFENPHTGQDWITLKLVGKKSNRAAIGAKVALDITNNGQKRTIYRTVSTGGSFGANSLQLEIGLGENAQIQRLKVFWPNGSNQAEEWTDLAVNQVLELVEGGD